MMNTAQCFRRPRILLLPALIWIFTTSCSSIADAVDSQVFSSFGSLVFEAPPRVTFKEIHLDGGNLLGQKAIVDGQVVGLGKHLTHIILKDETARMLIVLTGTWKKVDDHSYSHGDRVAVFGVVERGQGGLPYIEARATHMIFAQQGLSK